jgi:hypothetical protein
VTIKIRTLFLVLYLQLFLAVPTMAAAGPFSVQPRLDIGVMAYSFESEAVSSTSLTEPVAFNNGGNATQEAFEYNDNLIFVGAGGTFFLKRLFLDLSGQYAFDGQDSETAGISGFQMTSYDDSVYPHFLASDPVYDARFDRMELAASLGYAIGSRTSLFAGYKWTRTHFDTSYEGTYSAILYASGSDLGDEDIKYGGRMWGDAEYDFEYQGPFIGVVQGWDIRPYRWFQGVFTANLALAYLQSKLVVEKQSGNVSVTWIDDQQVPETVGSIEGGGFTNRFDTEGRTLGLTMGVAWRGTTAVDGLSYTMGIHGYRYEFDTKNNNQSDINETTVVYKFGLAYAF